jgi:hypothetical protein
MSPEPATHQNFEPNTDFHTQNPPPIAPPDSEEASKQTQLSDLRNTNTSYNRFVICNCKSICTLLQWEILYCALAIGSNHILVLNETLCSKSKLHKVMSPAVFMMYVCFDPEPPNGSEWAIAILTKLRHQCKAYCSI